MSNWITITDPVDGHVTVVTREQFEDKACEDVLWDLVMVVTIVLGLFIVVLLTLAAVLMAWIFG